MSAPHFRLAMIWNRFAVSERLAGGGWVRFSGSHVTTPMSHDAYEASCIFENENYMLDDSGYGLLSLPRTVHFYGR